MDELDICQLLAWNDVGMCYCLTCSPHAETLFISLWNVYSWKKIMCNKIIADPVYPTFDGIYSKVDIHRALGHICSLEGPHPWSSLEIHALVKANTQQLCPFCIAGRCHHHPHSRREARLLFRHGSHFTFGSGQSWVRNNFQGKQTSSSVKLLQLPRTQSIYL